MDIHAFPINISGDELQVECTFDTTGNKHWVINGPGTKVTNHSVEQVMLKSIP